MKELARDAWDAIVSKDLPRECEPAAHSRQDGVLPWPVEQVESLHWDFSHVKDPRKRNRSIGIGTVLTLFTMGIAAGANDLKAAHAYAARLTNEQLKAVGCAQKLDALGDPIPGKYSCPSYGTFYYILAHRNKAGRHDFDVSDFAAHLSRWLTAQEGKLPRHLAIDGKFVKEIVGLVSLVDTEGGNIVAVAPASKKKGLKGECEMPVARRLLAAQDLDNAIVSADALHSCARCRGRPVPGCCLVSRTFRRVQELKKGRRVGKPSEEVAYHVTSLTPEQLGGGDACAERLARLLRTHWHVESYHGKRDNGYNEDAKTRRCDTSVMSAMMVARTLGLWICARNPGKTTVEVRLDLYRHPSKLLRIMTKGGLQ